MSAGSIVIDLLARTGAFETDIKRASRTAQKSAKEMDRAYAQMAKDVSSAFKTLLGAITVRQIQQSISAFAKQGAELKNLASLTGSTVEEFQRFAAASSTVGIEQEKLGDIFKDFREKVGEFVQTGGGGMKDFFEQIAPQVGVTAEAFRNLSGPQAMQLYIDSLEKAGLSQEQMSFYLESMASDTTALIPLLRNGGVELGRLGDQAARTGQIISNETVAGAVQLRAQMHELNGISAGVHNTLMTALIPSLLTLGQELTTVSSQSSAVKSVTDGLATLFEWIAVAGVNVAYVLKGIGTEIGGLAAQAAALGRFDFSGAGAIGAAMKEDAAEARAEVDRLTASIRGARAAFAQPFVGPPAPGATGPVATGGAPFVPPPKKTGAPKVTDLQRMTKAFADQAATVGMTSEEVELYKYRVAGAGPAQLAFAASVQNSISSFEAQTKAMADGLAVMEATRTPAETYAAEIMRLNDLRDRGAVTQEVYNRAVLESQRIFSDTQESIKKMREEGERLKAMLEATPTAQLEVMREDMFLLEAAFLSGTIGVEEFVEAAQTRLGTLPDKIKEVKDAMTVFSEQAARNMQDAFAQFLFDPFDGGVKGMLTNFVTAIHRMASELLASQLLNMLGGALAGSGGFLGAFGTALKGLGGARADGGPVSSGMTYLVGERGPELFRPNTSGAIVPNHQMGSASQPAKLEARIINLLDRGDIEAAAADYLGSDAGAQIIINQMRRNSGAMATV